MDPQLVEITDALLAIVQSNRQDVNWQPNYANEQDLIEDLRDHAERMRRRDTSRLPELRYVLLPAGALSEIALQQRLGRLLCAPSQQIDEIYSGPSTPPREPTS